MSPPTPLPLPLYLAASLLQARLQGYSMVVPPQTVIDAIAQQPDLFHYRATRSGRLLVWDLQTEKVLNALQPIIPALVHAVRQRGLHTAAPFAAFQEDGPLFPAWQQLLQTISEPIVDTTDPNAEPIFGGTPAALTFIDSDTALDMLNEAMQLPEGPQRQAAIARAKDLLQATRV